MRLITWMSVDSMYADSQIHNSCLHGSDRSRSHIVGARSRIGAGGQVTERRGVGPWVQVAPVVGRRDETAHCLDLEREREGQRECQTTPPRHKKTKEKL